VSPTQWLAGGGAVGALIRSNDWVATTLGAIEEWPQSLRTSLAICLSSPIASCIAWGRQRLQLYNEKYAQFRGADAIGTDFADSWPEAWPSMRAGFERAFSGEPSLLEDQRVDVNRAGERGAASITFSFVPLRDESGGVAGVLISLLEPAPAMLRQELARAQQELDEYCYLLSHDVRAPLGTLESMARLLVTEYSAQLPADAQGLLTHITRGTTRLTQRIDALLRVAELSHQPLLRLRVDVAALLTGVIAQLRDAAPERRIEVVVNGDLPPVDGDPELLRLAFTNILANAFKFTRQAEHARIDVSGRRADQQNVYSIKDNGAGFEVKYAGKLFGLFQRMHGEAEFEGIGVGLALARRLVERHGGTIRAEARRGAGATFHVTLPAGLTCDPGASIDACTHSHHRGQ
jgi:signal transduction histidine kinase